MRAELASRGIKSVADEGFGAPGVVVSFTDDPDIQNGKKFTTNGVPLQLGDGDTYGSFRIGLFGLDKLYDIEGTVDRVKRALNVAIG